MHALVFQPDFSFTYADVPTPVAAPDEVLVQVKACAVCGSDVHGSVGANGRRIPPLIMGHEASGVIAALGCEVRGWQVGQRVTFDSTQYCGTCWFCKNGMHNLCATRRILGVACEEYRKNGAMADFVTVKAHTLYALPDEVSYEAAALTEPFAVGMHAACLAGELAGKTAVVVGAGTIGLMTLVAAKSRGAKAVFVSGHHADRQQTALALGADAAGDAAEIARLAATTTDGRGADVVFDSVGTQASFEDAMAMVRLGGTIVCIGNGAQAIEFPLQTCVVKQIRVICSYSSAGEYPLCLEAIAEGRVDLSPFLREIVPLSQGAQAFRRLKNREPGLLKIILKP